MPIVRMEGHDYSFPVSDVLRLFYGACWPVGSHEIRASYDPNIVIHSCLTDGIVSTWMDGQDALRCEPDKDANISPKREVKRQLYRVLSLYLNFNFPWGSLTGIRPTLVAREAASREELVDRYFLRHDKAQLAFDTARAEDSILARIPENEPSVYVGVPFCRSRCSYCSFVSEDAYAKTHLLPEYVDAVLAEIRSCSDVIPRNVSSLYVGGGTPTVLDDRLFLYFLENVFRELHADQIPEITVEAGRADTINAVKLRAMKDLGVHRICINPQTLSNKTLRTLGRNHTVEEFYQAHDLAEQIGFTTINMDIIAGLPDEVEEEFIHSLEGITALSPENITLHTLSRKRRAAMSDQIDTSLSESANQTVDDMLTFGHQFLQKNGYESYYLYRQKDTVGGQENTGYSKPGHACLYNVAMMSDQRPVFGFGAGSVSKNYDTHKGLTRSPNVREAIEYIRRVQEMAVRKNQLFRV
jgi:oxygen-independent coproporphyrinogen-3 oxidase